MHPLLDPEKQTLARRYEKDKRWAGLLSGCFSFLLLLIIFFSGINERIVISGGGSGPVITLRYLAILYSLLALAGLIPDWYSGFILEKKWGFSNQTFRSWFGDEIKSFLVGLLLMPLLLGLLTAVMIMAPDYWWLIAGLATALIGVIFATLFPVLILPLFNKYRPMDDENLRQRLTRILAKGRLHASGFFISDMSRQTKKENAFLAGMGRTRRVVLGDNLLNNMSPEEIETVLAHEVGHHRDRHIWKNILLGTGQQIILFYLIHRILQAMFPVFTGSLIDTLTLMPAFLLAYGGLSTLLFGPLNLALSRYFERQADDTALNLTCNPAAFQAAMAGLANRNLSNAYPAAWIKMLFYSHPPIGERLEKARRFRPAV
ncbi:MAG: M48 family metallopeptidase [Fidelibacterota bacterium]